jgi:hypothetical protein
LNGTSDFIRAGIEREESADALLDRLSAVSAVVDPVPSGSSWFAQAAFAWRMGHGVVPRGGDGHPRSDAA